MEIEDLISSSNDQDLCIIPMVMPKAIIDFLDNIASEKKVTTVMLVNDIFTNAIQVMLTDREVKCNGKN